MTQNYTEERVILEAVGTKFPAALTLPAGGREPRWGIVIIPGSMSSDVDGNYPSANMNPHMYADLARQLAERGHAALRYAKEGSDTGTVVVDEEKANEHPIFPRQQRIAAAACRKLRELVPGIERLAVAGHSEGSVHGLIISQQPDLGIDAFISLSGPALRYMDLFINMARTMSEEQGEIIDFGAFKVNAANYIRVFELMRERKPFTDEIKADPTLTYFVQNWDPEAPESGSYMLNYDAIDPSVEVAQVPCPVLVVQGGLDRSGVLADNGERLYQARRAVHPDSTAFAYFEDLQHFYKRATPELNSQESMALDGETDPRVADAISEWLNGLSKTV
jgi:hypothetical protein